MASIAPESTIMPKKPDENIENQLDIEAESKSVEAKKSLNYFNDPSRVNFPSIVDGDVNIEDFFCAVTDFTYLLGEFSYSAVGIHFYSKLICLTLHFLNNISRFD